MRYLTEEEKIRQANLYEEMKDLRKLGKIFTMKMSIFNQRNFQLRRLVLENLKGLINMQLKALDEEYKLIGLDEECWRDDVHFLHDLERKIEGRRKGHTKEQKERIVERVLETENKEGVQIELLLSLIKQYTLILYNELKKINLENLMDVKNLLSEEEENIKRIGRIINLEEIGVGQVMSK